MESSESILGAVKFAFAIAGVAALIAFVLRPLWRMLKTGPDPELLNPYAKLPMPEDEPELEIPVGGDGKKPDRSQLIDMARKEPRVAASLVRQWLREKK